MEGELEIFCLQKKKRSAEVASELKGATEITHEKNR
jgi:hypothetical protein